VLCHLVDHQKLSFIGEEENKNQVDSLNNECSVRALCLLCLRQKKADGGTLTDRRQCHAFFRAGRADKSGPDYLILNKIKIQWRSVFGARNLRDT